MPFLPCGYLRFFVNCSLLCHINLETNNTAARKGSQFETDWPNFPLLFQVDVLEIAAHSSSSIKLCIRLYISDLTTRRKLKLIRPDPTPHNLISLWSNRHFSIQGIHQKVVAFPQSIRQVLTHNNK